MPLPATLRAAILSLTQGMKLGALAGRHETVSETYRAGGTSTGAIDSEAAAAAYLIARLPATYAAVEYALDEFIRAAPQFRPASILDIGCGPGTAGLAALAAFPEAKALLGLDHNRRFLSLASRLAAESGMGAGRSITFGAGDIADTLAAEPADLVLCSYTLVELKDTAVPAAALRLWPLAKSALVLVEPGSRAGFARLRAARAALIEAGATILAPCTQANTCPMPEGDWCHFSVRLARSREHQRVKGASVPYEDEKFSYLIAARQGAPAYDGRIVGPVTHGKAGHRAPVCDAAGLHEWLVTVRDPAFKAAKKWEWGNGL